MARSMSPSRKARARRARVKAVNGRRKGSERMPAAKPSQAASMRGLPACASAPVKSDPAMANPIAFNSGTHLKGPRPAQRFAYRSTTCSMVGRYSSSASGVKARMRSRLRRRCFSPSRNGTASGLNSSSTCGGFAPARATFLSSRTRPKASDRRSMRWARRRRGCGRRVPTRAPALAGSRQGRARTRASRRSAATRSAPAARAALDLSGPCKSLARGVLQRQRIAQRLRWAHVDGFGPPSTNETFVPPKSK